MDVPRDDGDGDEQRALPSAGRPAGDHDGGGRTETEQTGEELSS